MLLVALSLVATTFTGLDEDRGWLFEATSRLPDSGFTGGDIGSSYDVVFPVGRGDRLYYFSVVVRDSSPQDVFATLVCWQRKGEKPMRQWEVRFKRGQRGRKPVGTLLRLAYEARVETWSSNRGTLEVNGFSPVRSGRDWLRAQAELETPQGLALYNIGQHGDISSKGHVVVLDASLRALERKRLEYVPLKSRSGWVGPSFKLTSAELKLIANKK